MLCHSFLRDKLRFERHGSEGSRHNCSVPFVEGRWVAGIFAAAKLETGRRVAGIIAASLL